VFLFTDGVDTASSVSIQDAVRMLEQLADPMYVFGIEPPPPEELTEVDYESLLQRFATASGGRYLRVNDVAKLAQFARDLRQELTMRYIITFEPAGIGQVKWRNLEIRVDGGLQTLARQGYRGTLP
jgi:hypothetical protein